MDNSAVTSAQQRLLLALANGGFPAPDSVDAGAGAIASPMRFALEWQGFHVVIGVQRYYAKVLHEDAVALVDVAASAAASRAAGECGAAPLLLLADTKQGVLLFQSLKPGAWRAACIDDLLAPERLAALWALKRKVHHGAATNVSGESLPSRVPEQDIERLYAMCVRDNAHLPSETAEIHQTLLKACHALQATQTASVPVHGDGVASNVMVRDSDELKAELSDERKCEPSSEQGSKQGSDLILVDFDRGGLADPWYDVATTLNELAEFPSAWREGIAAWQGYCSDADYARCRLYGLIDDWYWTLSSLWLSSTSPREHDFIKLAQWTLLRLREGFKEGRLDAWLSLVSSAAQVSYVNRGAI